MANKVLIKQFKNKAKKSVAGLTPEHAVYDANGVRLDAKLGSWNLSNIRDAQTEGVRAVREAAKQYDHQTVINNGTITNAADEEDITVRDNVLSLKDRTYIEGVNEMGYVILRKNKSFAEQVTKENTIYEIRYDFDLNGAEITLSKNSSLKFVGGTIKNGEINCNGNYLFSENSVHNCYNYLIPNKEYINIKWFKSVKKTFSEAMSLAIESAYSLNLPIYIPAGEYEIFNIDISYDNIEIYGDGAKKTILKNPTWGVWTFRSSSDYIHIHHLGCKALEVNLDTIRTSTVELDNGSSFILSKGNNCTFNDLYGEDIQTIIWLGGDYINESKYFNKVFNIESKNTSFAVLANLQNYAIIENIFGSSKQMIGKKADGSNYIGPPAHLLYLTTNINTPQENITINNIFCYPANRENGGSVLGCSYKGIKNCNISNIFDCSGGQVFQYLYENNYINNINVIGTTDYSYALLIDGYAKNANSNHTAINGYNINIQKGIFRISDTSVNINGLSINNKYYSGTRNTGIITANNLNNISVILTNVNIINNSTAADYLIIEPFVLGYCGINNLENGNRIVNNSKDTFKVNITNLNLPLDADWVPSVISYPNSYKKIVVDKPIFNFVLYKNSMLNSFNIECNDEVRCTDIKIIAKDAKYVAGQIIYIIVNNKSSNSVRFAYRDSPAISEARKEISPQCILYSKLLMTSEGLKEIYSEILGTSQSTNAKYGNSEQRPSNMIIGFCYYDSTLKKPIWWTGSKWVDAIGTDV